MRPPNFRQDFLVFFNRELKIWFLQKDSVVLCIENNFPSFDMKTGQIYATIKEAKRLQDAGFNKECVHHCTITNSHIDIFYNNVCFQTLVNDIGELFTKRLDLPNSEEIDLPEEILVYKRNGVYHFGKFYDKNATSFTIISAGGYDTKRKACIEAWLWAKQEGLLD